LDDIAGLTNRAKVSIAGVEVGKWFESIVFDKNYLWRWVTMKYSTLMSIISRTEQFLLLFNPSRAVGRKVNLGIFYWGADEEVA